MCKESLLFALSLCACAQHCVLFFLDFLSAAVENSKKWKEYYFSLKMAERHLLFFENENVSIYCH